MVSFLSSRGAEAWCEGTFSSVALLRVLIISAMAAFTCTAADSASGLRFEVFPPAAIPPAATNGRLFVILARGNSIQPRFAVGRTGREAPEALARDVASLSTGSP